MRDLQNGCIKRLIPYQQNVYVNSPVPIYPAASAVQPDAFIRTSQPAFRFLSQLQCAAHSKIQIPYAGGIQKRRPFKAFSLSFDEA